MHGQPFICLQKKRQMTSVYDTLCLETQCEPDVVFEANSIIDAAELCAAGMGATLVTDMLAHSWQRRQAPCFFELEEEVPIRQLVAAYGRHQHLSEAAREFIGLLKK